MRVRTVYASSVAKLNSNVYTGGGDDDTLALQQVLDEAKDPETGIHLIVDGAALITQLRVWSNTTIECLTRDCGFYQKDNSDCSMLCCAETTFYNRVYERRTKNVVIAGGTYNHNGQNQGHDNLNVQHKFDMGEEKWFNLCIELLGVEHLHIKDIIVRDFRTFAVTIGCFRDVTLENIWLELPNGTRENQDGYHFWGPGQFLKVINCGGRVGDDMINVGPDELDRESSITDVLIDGIMMEEGEQGIRLLSRKNGALDRVTIRNVNGNYKSYGFYIEPWFAADGEGNLKNIFIENVDLQPIKNGYDYRPPFLFSIGGNVECLTLKNIRHHNNQHDNRALIEIGLPFGTTNPNNFDDYPREVHQKIQTIIIDGLTITEQAGEPEGTEYIGIYDKVDNLILKNVIVIKDQEENGTLVHFAKKGRIENLVTENIHTKGLKCLFDDESKIDSHF